MKQISSSQLIAQQLKYEISSNEKRENYNRRTDNIEHELIFVKIQFCLFVINNWEKQYKIHSTQMNL